MNFSQNAVYAKVHALYAKRLTETDFRRMASFSAPGELINFLSSETPYSDVFGGFKSELSTEQIEELLLKHLYNRIEALSRYYLNSDKIYLRYFSVSNDVTQITAFLRLLAAGCQKNYLLHLPPFLVKYCSVNLYEIAKANNFNELLDSLTETPYQKILSPFRNINNLSSVLTVIETSLLKYRNSILPSIAEKNKEMQSLLKTKSDFDFILYIFRLTRFKNPSTELIKKNIIPSLSFFTKNEIAALINAENSSEITAIVSMSKYSKDFNAHFSSSLELQTKIIFQKKLYGLLRYSTDADAAMLAYVFLLKNEVKTICHIAQGLNYKLPAEEILSVISTTEGGVIVGN